VGFVTHGFEPNTDSAVGAEFAGFSGTAGKTVPVNRARKSGAGWEGVEVDVPVEGVVVDVVVVAAGVVTRGRLDVIGIECKFLSEEMT